MLLDKSGKKWASWRDGRVKRVLDIPAQGHQGSRAQYGCCQNMLPRVYNNQKRAHQQKYERNYLPKHTKNEI